MSTGLYSITTRASGTILTAAIYNADHQNHVTNQNPTMTGAYSDDATQMKLQTDPGSVGSESLAGSLGGELERLRYALAKIMGTTYWYDYANMNAAGVSGNIPQFNASHQFADSGIAASALPTTGDIKPTLKSVSDSGWVMANDGTIGDASSGATTRANADTVALFTLLWTNVSNTNCPVSGGRGGSAAADFAAHKTITLPKMLGRALASAGAGSGLTSRGLGDTVGAETTTLAMTNLPTGANILIGTASGSSVSSVGAPGGTSLIYDGDDTEFNNTPFSQMQPTVFVNFMIKL